MNSPEEFVLAAERRLNSDPQTADLTTALLSEVMEEFDCGHVTLLQRHRSTEVLEHLGACAPVSELPDVSPGNVHWQSRKTKTISLAAAALTDDQQLLLHAEFEDRVPDEHLLSALVEILADIRRRCLLSQVMTDTGIHQRELFAIQLFSSLDFSDSVHTIATDGAVVTGATRVTVARRIGQEWIVQATTGVTETNDRSDAVRKIRELIARQESQQSPSAAEPNALVAPLHRSGDWSETDWAIVFEFAAPPHIGSAYHCIRYHAVCDHSSQELQLVRGTHDPWPGVSTCAEYRSPTDAAGSIRQCARRLEYVDSSGLLDRSSRRPCTG